MHYVLDNSMDWLGVGMIYLSIAFIPVCLNTIALFYLY